MTGIGFCFKDWGVTRSAIKPVKVGFMLSLKIRITIYPTINLLEGIL